MPLPNSSIHHFVLLACWTAHRGEEWHHCPFLLPRVQSDHVHSKPDQTCHQEQVHAEFQKATFHWRTSGNFVPLSLHVLNREANLKHTKKKKIDTEKNVLSSCHECGTKKNFESPSGIEPQTFGFHAPMFYHWATETLQWGRSITKWMMDGLWYCSLKTAIDKTGMDHCVMFLKWNGE